VREHNGLRRRDKRREKNGEKKRLERTPLWKSFLLTSRKVVEKGGRGGRHVHVKD